MNDANVQVLVIGAGVTGIGAAYHLQANGLAYRILEATGNVGGVWARHRWHGARCDSDFIKYSFSFKPHLSPQCLQRSDQIRRYLHEVATEFGILPRIRFRTRVEKAVFDEDRKEWIVQTSRGRFVAQFLVNGNGYWAEPHVPAFAQADRFRGEILHTADLDRGRTFPNRNVVLVGSGSTAICCAPELARVSKSLVLLQRSPSYIYETTDRADALTLGCQALYRLGIRFPVKLLRYYLQCKDDAIFVGFRKFPRVARWIFRRHWLARVEPETLLRHFTPRYDPWQERPSLSIGLGDALRSGRIAIRTGEISRFTESSIVLADGEEIPCNTCVLATGLRLDLLKFDLYIGTAKRSLAGLNFYKRIMLGGVPNYFHPFGTVHSAWTQSLEPAIRLAIRIMSYMKKNDLRAVAVERKEVDFTPAIMPGYMKRHLQELPKPYGTFELPAIDNLVSYRFDPRAYRFS